MAVSIRFARRGRRNRPFFRIVVADSRSPRDSKFIDRLGYYDPIPDPEVVVVKKDRLIHWLLRGAQPTKSVKSILSRQGIWSEVVQEVERLKRQGGNKASEKAEPQPEVEGDQ